MIYKQLRHALKYSLRTLIFVGRFYFYFISISLYFREFLIKKLLYSRLFDIRRLQPKRVCGVIAKYCTNITAGIMLFVLYML